MEIGEKPISCLVYLNAGIHDFYDSLLALRAVKQSYPSLEYTIVADEKFIPALDLIPWISKAIPLEVSRWFEPIYHGRDMRESLPVLAQWLSRMVSKKWDFAIDWSFNQSSSYLLTLIPAEVKLGYARRKDMSQVCMDGWSHYIQGIVREGVAANIHLTDVLTTQLLTALQLRIGEPQGRSNDSVASKGFFRQTDASSNVWLGKYAPGRKWVVVHPSKIQGMWSKLIQMVQRSGKDYGVCLLSDERTASDAHEIEAELLTLGYGSNEFKVVDVAGQLDTKIELIAQANWVVSDQLDTIQLACIHGTRSIYLKPKNETRAFGGPYGNAHYVVELKENSEHDAKAVFAVWAYGLSEWIHHRNKRLGEFLEEQGVPETGIQVLRSKIRTSADGGGVLYEPLLKRPMELEDWTRIVVGQIARSWYCGWRSPVGLEMDRSGINPTLIQRLRKTREALQTFKKICQEGIAVSESIAVHCSKLKSEKIMRVEDRVEFARMGEKIQEIDSGIRKISQLEPALSSLANMQRVLMHNLVGDQLQELGKEGMNSFLQIMEGITIFEDWLDHTLTLAKPKAVASEKLVSLDDARKQKSPDPH